jgi:hypothetical protein
MSKQFAIKEVLDYTVRDYATKDPVFFVDYASSVGVESASERLNISGGAGNYTLASFDHTKTAKFTSTLPLVDLSLIGNITGKSVVIGATTVSKRELLYADATNKITLSETPIAGTIKLYLLEGERDHGEEQTVGTPASSPNSYSISGSAITLNATTAPEGTGLVAYYDYTSEATARKITLTADKFPAYVTVTGTGLWHDQVAGEDVAVQFQIKKAKVQPNFTLTMAASQATTLDLTYDMFAVQENGEKVYMTITAL